MKRIIGSILVVFALFESFVALAATTYQPQNLGYVNLSLSTNTITGICTSTAPTLGYLQFCTNCKAAGGAGTICVSTTTGAPGPTGCDFVLSTGTQCQ